MTDPGEACPLNEVHWHPEETEKIEIAVPGQATDISDFNQLASALASLQQRMQLALAPLALGEQILRSSFCPYHAAHHDRPAELGIAQPDRFYVSAMT